MATTKKPPTPTGTAKPSSTKVKTSSASSTKTSSASSTKSLKTPSTALPATKGKKEVVFKLPKTLAGCADLLYQTREARLALNKQVEALEKKEAQLRDYLIDNLPKSQATGVSGKVANATAVPKNIPQVKDWSVFHAYVKKNNAFDLLRRSISYAAVQERLDAGKTLPGVEIFKTTVISLKKV